MQVRFPSDVKDLYTTQHHRVYLYHYTTAKAVEKEEFLLIPQIFPTTVRVVRWLKVLCTHTRLTNPTDGSVPTALKDHQAFNVTKSVTTTTLVCELSIANLMHQ
ncbi:hypothetical protein KIN20_008346 [Parelaphostrongylus tenuis]|uniref:Uncharacterized protein n=1 Tax=Parelaphostrongylus tenuis TaxID=148309 RepID=A0AAD5MR16_PARTN|nr:hypothetical protein KIN20_008346 [Parelaphostrongylus tenuis]